MRRETRSVGKKGALADYLPSSWRRTSFFFVASLLPSHTGHVLWTRSDGLHTMAEEALTRQLDELEALAAMYSGDGESFAIEESHTGESSCTLSLHLGGVVASLSITLPRLCHGSTPRRCRRGSRCRFLRCAISAASPRRSSGARPNRCEWRCYRPRGALRGLRGLPRGRDCFRITERSSRACRRARGSRRDGRRSSALRLLCLVPPHKESQQAEAHCELGARRGAARLQQAGLSRRSGGRGRGRRMHRVPCAAMCVALAGDGGAAADRAG